MKIDYRDRAFFTMAEYPFKRPDINPEKLDIIDKKLGKIYGFPLCLQINSRR